MLLSVGGVIDQFLHASAGEEVSHLFNCHRAHLFYGNHAFRVEWLYLGACVLLACLLLRLLLFLLLFRLLLSRRRRDVLLANNRLLSHLDHWDWFGLLPLEFFEGKLVEDKVEFWCEPGEVLKYVSSVSAVILGESPPYRAVEDLHRFIEVLIRQLTVQIIANIAPFLPQVSYKLFICQFFCALKDVLDVEHRYPVVI